MKDKEKKYANPFLEGESCSFYFGPAAKKKALLSLSFSNNKNSCSSTHYSILSVKKAMACFYVLYLAQDKPVK
ncbi:hypothetical protein OAA58_04270 [Polaribacter sp.]|nr:hypothetical protein [Polaribacter sp.]